MIHPLVHLRMQAAFQQHIDAAVSKTVNLPAEAKPEAVRDILMLAQGYAISNAKRLARIMKLAARRRELTRAACNCKVCGAQLRRRKLKMMKASILHSLFSSARRRPARPVAAALLGLCGLVMLPAAALAGRVSGKLTGYENSTPEASRDLHFQNVITRDIYLSPTHTDGSFAANLPPGVYDLRAERGVILKHSIAVGTDEVSLGIVSDAAPYAPARLFDLQAVAPSILTSPAPSTAYIMTVDTTVPSSSATLVPKREIDWSKRPGDETAAAPVPVPVTPAPLSSGIPKLGVTPTLPASQPGSARPGPYPE